jgi:hypothetical protein
MEKRIINIINNYIRANLSKISVTSGILRYNFMCHKNAVHDAVIDKQDNIAMVFYTSNNNKPILHFINIDKKGNYKDNTLGTWSEMYDYYLIRLIPSNQFKEVDNIFESYRKELRRLIPFYLRWYSIEF